MNQKKIIYCILDWGLGHATRSIPIIEYLQEQGHQIVLASSKEIIDFTIRELGNMDSIQLSSHQPRYSKSFLLIKLLRQIPHFIQVFREDRKQIKFAEQELLPDMIISDNRFGCYSKNVKSLYLTHQIRFQLNGLLRYFGFVPEMVHAYIFRKYHHILIPDRENNPCAGQLSKRSDRGEYIGLLSRFKRMNQREHGGKVLLLLSGPEPTRQEFETILINKLGQSDLDIVLIRGTNKWSGSNYPENWKVLGRCTGGELEAEFNEAELVICRSGYSSVMDLIRIRKKALLVPTVGQAEQEYLALHLMQENWFSSCKESAICEHLVKKELKQDFRAPEFSFSRFQAVLDRLLENL